jgi:glucose/arabinose dehydrogenase
VSRAGRRLAAAFVSLALASAARAQPQVEDPALSVELLTGGLAQPTSLAFIGADDFLVLEKATGRVRRVADGSLDPTPVLDLAVESCSERGLLGIAVHPDFAAPADPKPWVYLFYNPSLTMNDTATCAAGHESRLARCVWDGGSLGMCTTLLSFPADAGNHKGGALVFGPDRTLYGVVGDDNRQSQLENFENGAPPAADELSSVVFRIDDEGGVPPGNPFTGELARVFAYGVRNSFGLAIDPATGDLWDTENGPGLFDEINHVAPGFNSGWRDVMGPGSATPGFDPGMDLVAFPGSMYRDPVYSIRDTVAVTGIVLPSEDSALGPDSMDHVLVGDFNLGQIYRFELNAGRDGLHLADTLAETQTELNQHRFASGFGGGISDLEEGPDGALYVVEIFEGAVWRVGPPTHDFAITRVKAPGKVSLSEKKPVVMKGGSIQLENQGGNTETIADAPALDALVDLQIEPSDSLCLAPDFVLRPPKQGFPIVVEPGKKLKLAFDVSWDCADLFETRVEIGLPDDGDPSDDLCPRAPAGGDKGCGGKGGGEILTSVTQK